MVTSFVTLGGKEWGWIPKILCCGTDKVKNHWEVNLYVQEGQRKTGGRLAGEEPTGGSSALGYLVKPQCTVISGVTAGPSPGIILSSTSCQSLAANAGAHQRREVSVSGIWEYA
jgi:hypothetical protein